MRIEGLRFGYPDGPPVVAGWSATLEPGVTLLHGDTGSGKSTLLRLLAGVLPAQAGSLALGGTTLQDDAGGYRQQLLYVDPDTRQHDQSVARDCLDALGAGPHGADAARREALVQGFGLAPHIDKPLYMLSTGSRRKVWLVAALASRRPLVLLDEPTAALDAPSVRCLWPALAEIAAQRDRIVVLASSECVTAVPLTARFALPL